MASSGTPSYTVNVSEGAHVTLNVMTAAEILAEESGATAPQRASRPAGNAVTVPPPPAADCGHEAPPQHDAPGYEVLGPGPSAPPMPRWNATLPRATLFAETMAEELPGTLLAGYHFQFERLNSQVLELNSEVLELREQLAEEHSARRREALLYQRGLAAEVNRTRAAQAAQRTAVEQYLASATLYASLGTKGKRFHTNPVCGGLHDGDNPRKLTYCETCSNAAARR